MKENKEGGSRVLDDAATATLMDQIIDGLFNDALRASLRSPAMAGFFIRQLKAQRKAAARRERSEKEGVHVPPVMIFSVTNACNLHCAGCYAHATLGTERPAELDAAGVTRLFAQAGELGISIVLLVGGEPLTRPEIFEATAAFPDMVFMMFTNGTLVDDGVVKKFAEQRNVIPILSLEGDEGPTDLRRGNGVHEKLAAAMDKLDRRGIFYGVSLTVSRSNLDLVTDESYILSLRDRGCKVFLFVEYNPVDEATTGWTLTAEQRLRLEERIASFHRRLPGVYLGFPGLEKQFGGCLSAGRGFIYVTASGGLQPCPFAPYSDRSVADRPLKDALGSPFLRTIREGRDELMEEDGACALWKRRGWMEGLLSGK